MKTLTSLIVTIALSGSMLYATESNKVDKLDDFFSDNARIVTPSTYPTDETSRQMLKNQDLAGINKFLHKRKLTPTDNQPVVRMNRDTYYSFAVIDVSKGATVTMPVIPEGKYISVQPITEDHRIEPMLYGAGTFKLSTHTGKHIYIVVRLDSTFSEKEAAKYQDQMRIDAKSSTLFKAEPVDKKSFETVENNLKAKVAGILKRDGKEATFGMFTSPSDTSNKMFTQEKYEVGAAIGWGGAQIVDNIYELSPNYPDNVCHQATFQDPKDKAFWSITVYDKEGFMFNDFANLSSNTATPNADGTYTLSFGCGENAVNNIETKNDSGVFNLAVRHYQVSDFVRVDGYRILPTMKAVK
jgi:hypothetical protein